MLHAFGKDFQQFAFEDSLFSRPHPKRLNLTLQLFPLISMLPGSGFATAEKILQGNGKD